MAAHVRRGGHVLGICGGYQMLGKEIHDPDGIEGVAGSHIGLGLLDVVTIMHAEKRLAEVSGVHISTGEEVTGYEIHIGKTEGPDCERAWLKLDGKREGAASQNGRIQGCYMHGIFSADAFRAAFLEKLGASSSVFNYDANIEQVLDDLADHLEAHMDLDKLLSLAQ